MTGEIRDSWRVPGRAHAAIAHAVVNGVGACVLGAMHLWGSLSPEVAAAGILALCGIWVRATRRGPPGGPPGATGAVHSYIGDLLRRGRK